MKRLLSGLLAITILVALAACSAAVRNKAEVQESGTENTTTAHMAEETAPAAEKPVPPGLINAGGGTVAERFRPPEGFERTGAEKGSFAEYLRNLPLKPQGAKVKYYNGETKPGDFYLAVLDIDTGDRDLQQCADAVMRLRAEYLYGKKLYGGIHFNFTSGFRADYGKWMEGYRIVLRGNDAAWVKKADFEDDYESFRKYLDIVYAYAGTLSLSKELASVPVADLEAGDVFIKGGSPGHAAIVVDTAVNAEGAKLFMLAQGYTPAQDIHLLKNPADEKLSPWYGCDFGGTLETPQWSFGRDQLMRFEDD